jgi:hypothetical protein
MGSTRHAGFVLIAIVAAAGCQDGRARQRAEIQRTIEAASASIRLASAQAGDPARQADAAKSLNRAVQDLARAGDGEPGQKSAAAQLAAAAHMQLASFASRRAAELEFQQRARRGAAGALAGAVADLEAIVAQLDAISVEAPLQELTRARDDSTQALSIFSGKVTELDGPIEQLNRQNETDRAEAGRLRAEAARLRASAAEAGAVEGLDEYEEAVRNERAADRIEFAIAERQVELRYSLESEHALARRSVESVQERIKTIEEATVSLGALSELADEEAMKTRDQAESSRARLQTALGELSATAEELAAFYEQAAGHLNRAATAARSAAGPAGDAADVPRLAAATAFQELAGLHLARAQGLQGQAALLEQMPETAKQAPAVREAARQAVEEAKAAYGEARSVLEQVRARSAPKQLESLRSAIAATEAAAGGAVIEPPKAGPAARPAPAGPGPAAERAAQGAESPEALLAAMRSTVDAESAARLTLEMTLLGGDSPEERAVAQAVADVSLAQIALERALKTKFGTGLMDLGMPGMQAGPFGAGSGVEYALGEVSGDHGVITAQGAGSAMEVEIVRSGDRWFIDGRAVLGAMIPPGTETQVVGMMQAMAPAMQDVARRVVAGEFASARDAMIAFGTLLQGGAPGR